ncbi:MAG: alanine racemase [Acidobacteria bacterium]|nr:alanine racemase [Acidobacteriota bacterium]
MKYDPTGRPTVSLIDLDALAFNYRSVRTFVGKGPQFLAVVKADGYGHGAVRCAQRLALEGVDRFGVALPEEGVELRNAGIDLPVLCLGGFWQGQGGLLAEYGLTPTICEKEKALAWNATAAAAGKRLKYHVKIDTGMGRLGIRYDHAREFALFLKSLEHIEIEGLMTHFASADDPDQNSFTREQIARFGICVDIFRECGLRPAILDMANSPGAIAHKESLAGMIRVGGLLYGLGGDVLPTGIERPALRPVMSLVSKIVYLKEIPAGDSLGYGRTYFTKRNSLIAAVPIGYSDGLPRNISNIGNVIVNDMLCPIVGRISMDWTLIDVTDTAAKPGDIVTLFGRANGVSVLAEDVARQAGTISYEITCGISPRVPRKYLEGPQ